MNKFYWMWIGQLISILASGITSFALGIWVLQQSESVTDFATVVVMMSLPGILLTPFIGSLVDRHNRKVIIVLADVAAAITTLCIAWLYWIDSLTLWHIYIVAVIDSVALAFQMPAVTAAVTMLVPKKFLGKAAGMSHLSRALSAIAGPFLAGLLINVIGLSGILIIDLVSFLIAATILLFIKIPHPKTSTIDADNPRSVILEAKNGWLYIMHRQGLKHLLIFAAIVNLVAGMVVVIVMPLALHMGTESQVGFILSAGGLGALLGSAYLTLTGGPQRKMNGVLIGTFFAGISLFVMGSQPIVWLVALAVLMFNACLTTAFGTEQVIWQHKVEASLQGRVFAAYDAVSTIAVPVGTFGVGLLADHWFEPLMMPDGGLADTFGPFIGIGPGRGLALMVIMLAVAMLLIAMWGWYNKAIFDIEKNLPDMIDDLHQQDAPSKLA